ncbi:MAG: hypothetical protein R3C56_38435 [Pirellulaceae bacterium]
MAGCPSTERDSFFRQVGLVFQDSVIQCHHPREYRFQRVMTDDGPAVGSRYGGADKLYRLLSRAGRAGPERGTTLSGGQKQRLCWSVLALNPRILLDDFTRVDVLTESKILANISAHHPELTLKSITQKSPHCGLRSDNSTDGRRSPAQGTHDELMQQSPEYVQIYNSTFDEHL